MRNGVCLCRRKHGTPIQKCKLSFHDKACYISRCIRMARMISVAVRGKAGLQKQIDLNKYTLTLINAFLSNGDYLPHRMMYQKMSLLSGMVKQYVDDDGIWHVTPERVHAYVSSAFKKLAPMSELKDSTVIKEISE